MVKRGLFYNMGLLLLLAPSVAAGQETALTKLKPLHFNAIYAFEFAGIPFGKTALVLEQEEKRFKAAAKVSSSGIARVFVKHDSLTQASGSGKNYVYSEAEYDSRYQTRKKKKHVQMSYKGGTVASQLVEPPDNRETRPEVPPELRKGTLDPLRFGLALRSGLHEALQKGEESYRIRLYDGRRLSEVTLNIKGDEVLRHNGQRVPVHHVVAARRLLEGHTTSELNDAAGGEPPLHIYFSHDRLVPVLMEVPLLLGVAQARLDKECQQAADCLPDIQP